jgi:hypothetical protein
MARSASIMMRIDPDQKRRIEDAARKVGQSLTSFLLEAAMKAAEKVENARPSGGRHGGVPKYFAVHCLEARRGGANGYAIAAYHLASHVYTEHPWDGTWNAWKQECIRLNGLCRDRDDNGVWGWFRDHYPQCMKLVPERRKQQFLRGVYQAHQEGRIS